MIVSNILSDDFSAPLGWISGLVLCPLMCGGLYATFFFNPT